MRAGKISPSAGLFVHGTSTWEMLRRPQDAYGRVVRNEAGGDGECKASTMLSIYGYRRDLKDFFKMIAHMMRCAF